MKQTIDYDPTEAMVEEGARALSQGKLEEARFAFEEALRRHPEHPRALLGLSYIKRQTDPPPPGGDAVLAADLEIVSFVRQKRYEEALEALEATLLVRPDDETLQRSIEHIQGHLTRKWTKLLGGPDAMIALQSASTHPLASHMPAPLAEVLEAAPGFDTLRTLIDWQRRDLLRMSSLPIAPIDDETPRSPTPTPSREAPVRFKSGPHPRESRPVPAKEPARTPTSLFVMVVLLLGVGLLALWWVTRGGVPTPNTRPTLDPPAAQP
ncbi:MAG: tetratricopeptide repeat protein [Myxococcota bacterium]